MEKGIFSVRIIATIAITTALKQNETAFNDTSPFQSSAQSCSVLSKYCQRNTKPTAPQRHAEHQQATK
jgi:hypothetical protein